jgi:hypothetical protein
MSIIYTIICVVKMEQEEIIKLAIVSEYRKL